MLTNLVGLRPGFIIGYVMVCSTYSSCTPVQSREAPKHLAAAGATWPWEAGQPSSSLWESVLRILLPSYGEACPNWTCWALALGLTIDDFGLVSPTLEFVAEKILDITFQFMIFAMLTVAGRCMKPDT